MDKPVKEELKEEEILPVEELSETEPETEEVLPEPELEVPEEVEVEETPVKEEVKAGCANCKGTGLAGVDRVGNDTICSVCRGTGK